MILLRTKLTQFPLMPVELVFDSSPETLKNEGPLSRASWKAKKIAKRANSGFRFKFQLFPVHTEFALGRPALLT